MPPNYAWSSERYRICELASHAATTFRGRVSLSRDETRDRGVACPGGTTPPYSRLRPLSDDGQVLVIKRNRVQHCGPATPYGRIRRKGPRFLDPIQAEPGRQHLVGAGVPVGDEEGAAGRDRLPHIAHGPRERGIVGDVLCHVDHQHQIVRRGRQRDLTGVALDELE